MAYRNGDISHWNAPDSRPAGHPRRRHRADAARRYDLVIVGGGFTGLWAAYHAATTGAADSIAVLEAEQVGYGASGRNGGWLSTLIPGNPHVYEKARGLESVRTLQRMLVESIDEVVSVAEQNGIDAGIRRGGNLQVATTQAGLARLRAGLESERHYGLRADEIAELSAEEATGRINVAGTLGATFTAPSTRVQPMALVRGLADLVESLGVEIFEGTRAARVDPGVVATERGPVHGAKILLCTEGYSGGLVPGNGVIPINSSMIATEPLTPEQWSEVGWEGHELLGDTAHAFIYAQRTNDGRIAIGGRGSPYGYGGDTAGDGALPPSVVRQLRGRLADLFPGLDAEVAHAWRGMLGVSRDWCTTVRWDGKIGYSQGYAGHGVTAAFLAARSLVDRAAGRTTAATGLPWNDHESGRWEPDPIRWLGIHSLYRVLGWADGRERTHPSERTPWPARVAGRVAGMH